MTTDGVPAELREATLQSLGYICENISPEIMSLASNHILTAVVRGMQAQESENNVKLAAVKTLTFALEFSEQNWKNEGERTYLMNVIIASTGSTDPRVRRAAFECLVRVASLYYDYLENHIKGIFDAAWQAIKEDVEDVAKQAIEFWSSVCDEEIMIMQADAEGLAGPNGQKRKCLNIIKRAVPALAPVLTQALLRGEPDPDSENWNVSMAAGTCLDLIANTVGDEVVPHVLPFVDANIQKPNPREREVALLAFGSILEGPVDKIREMLDNVLPALMNLLGDANASVKDTTAWVLGRVAQFHGEGINPQMLTPLVQRLVHVLGDDPRVAANSCWALNNLAELAEEGSMAGNPFAEHFVPIVKALLDTADREDADESNLRASAYETINAIIKCIPEGLEEPLANLVNEFMGRLNNTFNNNGLDREENANLQGLLCGVLQTLTRKLDNKISFFTESLMGLYFRLFGIKSESSASLHEEALLAVGALINSIGAAFEPFMHNFMQFLLQGIANRAEYHVCSVAVGTVGDLARALGPKILEFTDVIIQQLETNVADPTLHRSVKPVIISCYGDIALAVSGSFAKYLPGVMDILNGACEMTAKIRLDQTDNWDTIVNMQGLRHSILEAYSGILLGLNEDHKAELIMPYVNGILHFLHMLTTDQCRNEEVARGAVGLLGDIVNNLGPRLTMQQQIKTFFTPLIDQCLKAENDLTRETAAWTSEVIAKNC
jgi:importin subunit beta-1